MPALTRAKPVLSTSAMTLALLLAGCEAYEKVAEPTDGDLADSSSVDADAPGDAPDGASDSNAASDSSDASQGDSDADAGEVVDSAADGADATPGDSGTVDQTVVVGEFAPSGSSTGGGFRVRGQFHWFAPQTASNGMYTIRGGFR